MRMMRWVLACVLSLGVAVQGYASVRAMDATCPMRQPAPAAGMHDMHQLHAMHDMAGAMEQADAAQALHEPAGHDPAGHDDCGGAGSGSKHCGCVTGCQPAGSLLALLPVPASALLLQRAPGGDAPSFHSHHSFRHWRPPAPT